MAKKAVTESAPLMPAEVIDRPTPAPLARVVRENAIDTLDAASLIQTFSPVFEKAQALVEQAAEVKVTDATQLREMKRARELRLQLKDLRVNAEKSRKALKEDSLRKGKAIDGVYNVIRFLIEPVEEQLEHAEKFAERAEAARIAALGGDRQAALRKHGVEMSVQVLGEMEESAWDAMLAGAKAEQERKAAEAKRAEEKRAKEEAEQRAERERLAAEHKKLAAEREAFEKAQREAEAKAKAEREEADRKLRLAEQARADVERQQREAEAEKRRQEAAAAEAARKAAAAPDAEKLRAFSNMLGSLEVPTMATNEGAHVRVALIANVMKLAKWIEEKADTLAEGGE